jgi:hypothetical protein
MDALLCAESVAQEDKNLRMQTFGIVPATVTMDALLCGTRAQKFNVKWLMILV